MNELLTAASVLLAIVGVLYALWHDDIKAALAKEMPKHKEDRGRFISKLSSVLWSRAIPLAIASLSVGLVFFPPCIQLVRESFSLYQSLGFANLANYDAIATSLVLVEVFVLTLAVQSVISAYKLWSAIRTAKR
ncbi:hypothetical protein [Thiococcus pfennigii]|uniref:hypothetical protein n=1 Tax=Thiococcus pfennigii TaxID=1057 RepID=UPI001A939A57|nr:hypothetical protein [Thiococcus pfennigii]